MIQKELLSLLVCPTDRSPLRIADERVVAHVNRAIAAGKVTNQGGRLLDEPIDGGLVRGDSTLLYPIRDGIPVLLANEAIPLANVG